MPAGEGWDILQISDDKARRSISQSSAIYQTRRYSIASGSSHSGGLAAELAWKGMLTGRCFGFPSAEGHLLIIGISNALMEVFIGSILSLHQCQ